MSIIKIEDIAHVRFSAPDLSRMRVFLEDFGLKCFEENGRLYGHGTDGRPFLHSTEIGEPGFRGLGFQASSLEDLEELAKAEGTGVEPLTDPGGGYVVRLTDPDGFAIEVVAQQTVSNPTSTFVEPPRNSADHHPRIRETVRLEKGASHIKRLGHCVLNVSDFRNSETWYKERFGLLTSDEVEAAPDVALGAFMRCDRGEKPSDHHTLFLAQLPEPQSGFMHAAFEVSSLDDLMLGHSHLKTKGYDQAWGVGRHVMGSQIFDYWLDPWGHELEHWTDGDLLTASDAPNKMPLSSLLEVQWGAQHPMVSAPQSDDK